MFCTKCGSNNPEDARYCHKCGYAVWQVQQELVPPPRAAQPALAEVVRNTTQASQSAYKRKKPDDSLKGVKGWLLFLCVSLTILSPIFSLGQLSLEWQKTEPYFKTYPHLQDAVVLETWCIACLIIFSVYAGHALWNIKPGAVKVAKSFYLTSLIFSLVFPFYFAGMADLPSVANNEIAKVGIMNAIRGILAFAIWFTYLHRSKRVRATYPTPETHLLCPKCRKFVPKEDDQCEYCGCNLIPQP